MELKIEICHDDNINSGDPNHSACSSDDEIDKWLSGKNLQLWIIESKINFQSFDKDDDINLLKTLKRTHGIIPLKRD